MRPIRIFIFNKSFTIDMLITVALLLTPIFLDVGQYFNNVMPVDAVIYICSVLIFIVIIMQSPFTLFQSIMRHFIRSGDHVSYFWPVSEIGENQESENGEVTKICYDSLVYPENEWGMFMALEDRKRNKFNHWQAIIQPPNDTENLGVPLTGLKIVN